MWKPNFFPAQACRRATCSRWKTKTSLPAHCQKPVVMETSSCFHVRNFGQTKNAQNQSASPKTHSRLHTVVLVWNKTCFTDFKPASTQTVCHIHDVILYDITCLVHPNASWWPLERKTNEFLWWLCHSAWKKSHLYNRADLHGLYVYFGPKLPRLLPITCACYGPGWDTKFPHPLSSSCDFFTHKLCIPGRNDLKFHVGIS